MARCNLNFDRLSAAARDAARDAGLNGECRNPFRSIVVRAVETLYACDEALRIIEEYGPADEPAPNIDLRAATGRAFTEAPRGTLYHRYEIDEHGAIRSSRIVPPTSQNQKIIEQDLWRFVPQHIDLPSDKLRWQCEQAVRNYDPCISCSTHFLKLDVERE